ncbi:MAG: diadenylate cyclase [Deferribacteres bacterium]|jgi:uncharacterized protein (TIGR00159 family)|nr:diadenylate cyclase [Deferribacteres bacterium]
MIDFIKAFSIVDIVDIAIISFLIYRGLLLIKGTRAFNMIFGIIFIIIVSFISKYIGLKTTSWVMSNLSGYLFLTIIILFQPEIRRALAFIGETKVFGTGSVSYEKIIDEITKAATILANRQIGALIVLENETKLEHYIQAGSLIDSVVTKDLLVSIFIPYSPLHDGAVIISEGKLKFAGSILPLTKRENIDKKFGTRHRAALGITEETDAICIVVSEERGTISLAYKGKISTELDAELLKSSLIDIVNIYKNNKKGKSNGK